MDKIWRNPLLVGLASAYLGAAIMPVSMSGTHNLENALARLFIGAAFGLGGYCIQKYTGKK